MVISSQAGVWLTTTTTTPFHALTTTHASGFSRRKSTHFPQALMTSTATKMRLICPSCSKPPRTCLCSRFQSPPLDNSVHVTILQHNLERNHPLNSTRIAKLGLQNVTVASVSDVLTEATYVIHEICTPSVCENVSLSMKSDEEEILGSNVGGVNGEIDLRMASSKCMNDGSDGEIDEACIVKVTMGKYGSKSSCELQLPPQLTPHRLNFDQVLDVPGVASALANGFTVKRIGDMERLTEFELNVPRGSILLFPSDNAVDVKDLVSNGIEVKNLIVLDGTWAKATRMYSENPWLKALPHLKLELDKSSLYGEVRTQPKEKYLSTIESIVYALKAVGDSPDGLDGLLDVFESMVGDQRRCMHERLSNLSQV